LDFHRYGGRGIGICDRWRDDPQAFAADMGRCPEGHQIDRIDNDDYSPENCRWASPTENSRNKSNNLRVDYRGENRLVVELAEEHQIPYITLYYRLYRYGLDPVEAVERPIRGRRTSECIEHSG